MTDSEILEQARALPAEQLPSFLGTLAHASALAMARLQVPAPQPKPIDRLLNVSEAAAMLGCSRSSLYHGVTGLAQKRVGRKVMYSEYEIQRFIRR